MTRPCTPTTLRLGQRLAVMGWRSLQGVAGVFNSLKRLSPPGKITQHTYGAHPDERLEIISPNATAPKLAPIVYIHGGGWVCSTKEMFTGDLLFLAEAGHPVFNVEYPLAPERPHPQMLLSLLDALSWIHEQHPEHESVHLMGDSAGGNLAMMLAILTANRELIRTLDPNFTAATPRPQSATCLYGVLERMNLVESSFPTAATLVEAYAGPAALTPEGSPDTAITPMDLDFASLPPTFVAAAGEDPLAENSRIGVEHLRKKHFEPVDFKVYDGEHHGFFTKPNRPACQELRTDILNFLAKH